MITIFLDVDGVLNSNTLRQLAIDPAKVQLLRQLCLALLRAYVTVEIVISSSWRVDPDARRELLRTLEQGGVFRNPNVVFGGMTPFTGEGTHNRGREIFYWLRQSPRDTFLILDDDDTGMAQYGMSVNHIKTDPTVGLTKDDVESALKVADIFFR